MVSLTGDETLQVLGQDGKGQPAASTLQCTTGDIAVLASSFSSSLAVTTLSSVGAGTITAAGIVGGVVSRTGSQSATAFTDTTATAALIIAALPSGIDVGHTWKFTYQNTTNAPATITGGTGVTVSGITTVYANSTAEFLFNYTAANTLTMTGYARGVYPAFGTFLAGGASLTIVVADGQVSPNSQIEFTVKTTGGVINAMPRITSITAGTGFTASYGSADVSVYNYSITY